MSTTAFDKELQIDRAVCRGILYDVIALGLRPPTADSLGRLRADGAAETLIDAAALIDGDEESAPVGAALVGLVVASREADLDGLRGSHGCLFGHTGRGKISPYETEYGIEDPFRQSGELADLNGFYRAFGLHIRESRRERCDHMAAECEFLSFLACKEAYDLIDGCLDSSEEVRRAEMLFLRDHAGRFGRAFALSLEREADQPFYRALGKLCFTFLTGECESLGVQPGTEFIALRSTADDNVPMACGSCRVAELAGGSGECGPGEE